MKKIFRVIKESFYLSRRHSVLSLFITLYLSTLLIIFGLSFVLSMKWLVLIAGLLISIYFVYALIISVINLEVEEAVVFSGTLMDDNVLREYNTQSNLCNIEIKVPSYFSERRYILVEKYLIDQNRRRINMESNLTRKRDINYANINIRFHIAGPEQVLAKTKYVLKYERMSCAVCGNNY